MPYRNNPVGIPANSVVYVNIEEVNAPISVRVRSGAASVVTVATSLDQGADVRPAAAVWNDWPFGAVGVGVTADNILASPAAAIRFTNTGADISFYWIYFGHP